MQKETSFTTREAVALASIFKKQTLKLYMTTLASHILIGHPLLSCRRLAFLIPESRYFVPHKGAVYFSASIPDPEF